MERFVDAFSTNDEKVKVRNQLHIPNDLFFSILSKLPIKSLKRFGCVLKSWSLLFDNPYFMTLYRNNFLTNDRSYHDDDIRVLLHQTFSPWDGYPGDDTFELYSVYGERFEKWVKLDWSSIKLNSIFRHKTEYDSGFNILGSGSVHGTLCLLCTNQMNIILWNPSTKEYKLIPPSPFDSGPNWGVLVDHHEFGYDSLNNDYKVMCHGIVVDETNYGPYMWEIYSLRSNSWRKLDVDIPKKSMRDEQLYIDGLSHWLCNGETYNETYLLSFDWSNEVFLTTPIPSDAHDNFKDFSMWRHLVLLNDSISFILNHKETATFNIYILGELGVKKSWVKIFIVGPLNCLEYPVGAVKSDIFFRKEDGGLVRFDLNTQKIEELGIVIERFHCKILIHKENLLPLEGANI